MLINRSQILRAGLAALIGATAGPALAQPARGVNGRTVTSVTTTASSFVQRTGGRWEERDSQAVIAAYEETSRDDWIVYLIDRSRGVRIQLDLSNRNVMYADDGAPQMRVLYRITDTSDAVTGWNLTSITYPEGSFRMIGPGQWVELGNSGGRFDFAEGSRGSWNVYLIDRSRNVEIVLDIRGRQVLYNEIGQPRGPLYPITGVRGD